MMEDIKNNRFTPNIVRDGNEPKEFSSIELTQYSDLTVTKYDSISEVLELYYSERNTYTRIRQKSADLRKHVNTLLERNQKKYSLQMKQLKDSEKREKYKVYGELINAFGYGLTPDDKFLKQQTIMMTTKSSKSLSTTQKLLPRTRRNTLTNTER